MNDQRPNPDELLARVQDEAARAKRGRLRIFLGYAAGVGKTFAMLEAARREKAEGVDIVVGYVEPHGRQETERLLDGLEIIPHQLLPYQGVSVREFDLDAALRRKPRLLLVDELAHTNAEGSRHAKRWQDVDELLAAGIDVWTTLNVQHLESLNDVIAQITGVIVRETVPDAVIEKADQIELIDITPEELIERLQAGKVYLPVQAERALQGFFQKSNLVALREISLREAADRLQKDVAAARKTRSSTSPWATRDRLLVCIGPSPTSARLLRTSKRMADALDAEFLAVTVDAGSQGEAANRVARHMRLAEQLGAETHVLSGGKPAETILEFSRSRNVTKIVVGKTARVRWQRWLRLGMVDQLLENSGDIDVYVIRGSDEAEELQRAKSAATKSPFEWKPYAVSAFVVLACTLLGGLIQSFGLADANIIMVYLLGVATVAARYGRGAAISSTLVSVLLFDVLFVVPFYSLAVSDAQYLITFAIMLVIGMWLSVLSSRARSRLLASQNRERRSDALYRLTKQLSEVVGSSFLYQIAGRQLGDIFGGEVLLFVRSGAGTLELRFGQKSASAKVPVNAVVAQWVSDHNQIAGLGTDTLPNGTAYFVPLIGSSRTVGAVGVRPEPIERMNDPEQRRLLETCASLIALAIERDQSVLEAHRAKLLVETEQMRSSLLSSVSHDLRTPLAAIAGTASSLMDERSDLDPKVRRELLQSLVDESLRLSRLVENLLDMTRLESGSLKPNCQLQVAEEIVGTALRRMENPLAGRPVSIRIPADLPLISVDGLLLELVLVNLLENAVRYTPPNSPIEVEARVNGEYIEVAVRDSGPGIPPGLEERIFEKFFRGTAVADSRRGVGLGLAVCRGIIEAHGGTITARNRPEGGAEFLIRLPKAGT